MERKKTTARQTKLRLSGDSSARTATHLLRCHRAQTSQMGGVFREWAMRKGGRRGGGGRWRTSEWPSIIKSDQNKQTVHFGSFHVPLAAPDSASPSSPFFLHLHVHFITTPPAVEPRQPDAGKRMAAHSNSRDVRLIARHPMLSSIPRHIIQDRSMDWSWTSGKFCPVRPQHKDVIHPPVPGPGE